MDTYSFTYLNRKRSFGYMLTVFLTTVMFLYVSNVTKAQTGNGALDRQQIVLGEQAKLHLKISGIPAGYDLASFYGWDTSNHHVEIVEKAKIDTVNFNDQLTYLQDWTITSFDSGKWSLPIISAVLKNRQTGQTLEVKIDSIYLDVMSVDISNMKDYHDIKDILTVKYFNPFWIIVGIVAVVFLILLFFLIRYFIRRKKKKPVKQKKIAGSPLDWVLGEIEKLQSKKVTMYQYFGELNEIVRTYLHEKANLPTQHDTSDELILRMRDQYNSEIVADSFYQNLKLMDAVKFAKYVPSEEIKTQKTNEIVDALKLFDKKVNEPLTK
ncbi:MAG: hypothetical protein DI598_01435 [Pseudopedobacter saltans]|uniref:Protein BatD n=1 Tax=Pseudopedobacter saltans TaxID=151895 RepID=A0A2W5FER6_9SPHI|nr:MAG: hypothetical protein DI598_01435 [Pseudopedobacter saltans]